MTREHSQPLSEVSKDNFQLRKLYASLRLTYQIEARAKGRDYVALTGEEKADMPFQGYGIDMGSLYKAQDQDLFDNLASQQMDEYQLILEHVP